MIPPLKWEDSANPAREHKYSNHKFMAAIAKVLMHCNSVQDSIRVAWFLPSLCSNKQASKLRVGVSVGMSHATGRYMARLAHTPG